MFATKQLMAAIDFNSMVKKKKKHTVGLQTHTGLEQVESE